MRNWIRIPLLIGMVSFLLSCFSMGHGYTFAQGLVIPPFPPFSPPQQIIHPTGGTWNLRVTPVPPGHVNDQSNTAGHDVTVNWVKSASPIPFLTTYYLTGKLRGSHQFLSAGQIDFITTFRDNGVQGPFLLSLGKWGPVNQGFNFPQTPWVNPQPGTLGLLDSWQIWSVNLQARIPYWGPTYTPTGQFTGIGIRGYWTYDMMAGYGTPITSFIYVYQP